MKKPPKEKIRLIRLLIKALQSTIGGYNKGKNAQVDRLKG